MQTMMEFERRSVQFDTIKAIMSQGQSGNPNDCDAYELLFRTACEKFTYIVAETDAPQDTNSQVRRLMHALLGAAKEQASEGNVDTVHTSLEDIALKVLRDMNAQ